MEVVLIDYGKEELEYILGLLNEIKEIKKLSAFDRFSKALEYLEHNDTDLILIDADDEENSWKIFRKKVKDINGAAKVVLMSRDETAAIKAHEEGVWDYLLKPVKRKQLERVVTKEQEYKAN